MQKEKLEKLAAEKSNPCVTISLNTHRTHPENTQDAIALKKLCDEAEERLVREFGKRPIAPLLEKLKLIPSEINENNNLDSLHIFLSNTTQEIFKSTWPTKEDRIFISDSFGIGPIIKSIHRSVDYLILVVSQGGAKMFEATNDAVVSEILNDYFPFTENPHFNTEPEKLSDPKSTDNMVREFLNKVDKAAVKMFYQTNLHCVVICTDDNYSRLMQVADKPDIYAGHANIDYNNQGKLHIAEQGWEIVKEIQTKREKAAIEEIKDAIGHNKAITGLSEIYKAAKEGRGELLLVQNDSGQAIKMTRDDSFELVDDVTQPGVIDDITSKIAIEIFTKKGRVVFTDLDELKGLGDVVLKTRY
ncbi:MAG: hypothetical protein WC780_13595 [Lentimicrobiaceae bacterium]|jgi:hypothetical protein